MKTRMFLAMVFLVCAGKLAWVLPAPETPEHQAQRIQREVRHELVLLPYVGVFDNLGFGISGSEIVLNGQVTRASLKSDAENTVRAIEGVGRVNNQIEILPISQSDNALRLRLYRAIYGFAQLQKYALSATQTIRIIVKNGQVTLEGVVDSPIDKEIAGLQAKSVSEVFSVQNSIRVVK